jgi:Flp pilus assembly protein TadD
MDAQIGRLVQTLKADGARDNTLIIVVGDHGEGLGEHDEATHSKLIYESTMRVPLIIACAGLFRGPHVVDDVVVSIADIFPTVVDLLGVKDARPCDGLSLLPDRVAGDRIVYMETLAPYLDNGWSPLYGLRRHKDKYILAPSPEYYDLNSDPNELNNIYTRLSGAARDARDVLVAALSSRLAKWPSIEGVVASAQPLDPESIRRLESLGYVGSISATDTNEQLPDPKDMMPVMRAVDRARGLGSAGRHEQALTVIKEADALSPNDPNVLLTMGRTYLFLNRLEEAEQTFRTANALRPAAKLCIFLAQIMLADGRLSQAAELLDQAETLEPLHGGIYLARGDLLALRGLPDEAIAAYEHAGEVDPYRASKEAQSRIARLREILRIVQPP